jgi:tetratricopeptide (TPR) repeat protein
MTADLERINMNRMNETYRGAKMKRIANLITAAALLIILFSACARTEKMLTATELLDLGEKYLLEMNYEQAIIQFTKLIEIEPKNVRAYLGGADAALHLDKQQDAIELLESGFAVTDNKNLAHALTGVEKSVVEGYIALAEAYEAEGWHDKAMEILQRIYNETGDEVIGKKLGIVDASSHIAATTAEGDETLEYVTDNYYDTLANEQKALLYDLVTALRAYDYLTAETIQRSNEFRNIVDGIPGDEKSMRYTPDNSATFFIFRGEDEPYSYHADMYVGQNGQGVFIGGNCNDSYYSLHVVDYADGKANGSFTDYTTRYEQDGTHFGTNTGFAKDGRGIGSVTRVWDGETRTTRDADQIDWWPVWAGQ